MSTNISPPNLKEMSDAQLQAKPCKNCGVVFKNSKHPRQPYCSRPCYYEGRFPNQRLTTTCEQCGTDFWYYASRGDVKFCTQKCYLSSPLSLELRARQKPTKENHWNWKGGIIRGRPDRNLGVYKRWRKAVFERDNYTCQHCDKRGGWLEADHIESWTDFPDLRYELTNGRTLCRPCHNKRTSEQLKLRYSHV